MFRPLFLRLTLLLAFAAVPALHAQREYLTPDQIEYVDTTWPGMKKTGTGIRYKILQEGAGAIPKAGDKVAVLYVGSLLNGKVFDRSPDREHPLVFRVARGEVIEGWNQILKLMHVGEKRVVVIPSSLAYGSKGQPPAIPRDSALVFEMELLEIK